MPIRFAIEDGVLIFFVSGSQSFADGLRVLSDGFAAYDALPAERRLVLLDVAAGTEGRTSDEVHTFARVLREKAGQARVAFVAEHDLHFGLARMAQAVGSSEHTLINVFRSRDRAVEWLFGQAE